MDRLPEGTVTFLLTDVEGSVGLWQKDSQAMHESMTAHDRLVKERVEAHGGFLIKKQGEGDSTFSVFPTAIDAVAAAIALQESLAEKSNLKVRMALHTGDANLREGDYYGSTVNRTARMRGIAYGGQILASEATVKLVKSEVPPEVNFKDLGVQALRGFQERERVYQVSHPDIPGDFPPLRTSELGKTNLPSVPTSLIGREAELTEIRQILGKSRLVTLTGTGGAGKTRLGIELATQVLHEFPDGAWFVDLASLRQGDLIVATVGAALGIRERGEPATDAIVRSLATKRALLLFDNCEHLVDAVASFIDRLLTSCRDVSVLATSRERLGVSGESIWPVPPLRFPEPDAAVTAKDLYSYDSVRLFVERAQAAHPSFTLDGNSPAVAEICRRLEGVPLAIELAAARVDLMSPEQIQARLGAHLRLLVSGPRSASTRQQTMRAAIDWSHELLTEPERTFFRRISIFEGGFTLEAAEGICSFEPISEPDVLDLLDALVEKSLVFVAEAPGSRRYRLLETVREFAAEKREGSADRGATGSRHLEWFTRLAEESESELIGPDQEVWLEQLDAEKDNFRAALEVALSGDEDTFDLGLRLVVKVTRFWFYRGYLSEGTRWTELALHKATGSPPNLRSQASYSAAMFRWSRAEYSAAREFADQALELCRASPDPETVIKVSNLLAVIERAEGKYELARARLQDALAAAEETKDLRLQAIASSNLGALSSLLGDLAEASERLERSLSLQKRIGDRYLIIATLGNLGNIALVRGQYDRARSLYDESLEMARGLGHKQGESTAIDALAELALDIGDPETAVSLFQQSLTLANDLGDTLRKGQALLGLGQGAMFLGDLEKARELLQESVDIQRSVGTNELVGETLGYLAEVAWRSGDLKRARELCLASLEQAVELGQRITMKSAAEKLALLAHHEGATLAAARLFGVADAWRASTGAVIRPADQPAHDEAIADVRQTLGESDFEVAFKDGVSLSFEEGLAVVREFAVSA